MRSSVQSPSSTVETTREAAYEATLAESRVEHWAALTRMSQSGKKKTVISEYHTIEYYTQPKLGWILYNISYLSLFSFLNYVFLLPLLIFSNN